MLDYNVFNDAAKRCGGEISIGVTGPARSGKSTLVGALTAKLFINGADGASIGGAGSGAGTGADGFHMPPAKVAEEGGENSFSKVFSGANMGVLVTSDGSIENIPRSDYVSGEEKAAEKLQASGVPYVIILNCRNPQTDENRRLKAELEKKYGVAVIAADCQTAEAEGLSGIVRALLFEFPVCSVDVNIPEWLRFMPAESSAICELIERVKVGVSGVTKMKDCTALDSILSDCKFWKSEVVLKLDLAAGTAELSAEVKEGVFYDMLSEIAGETLGDEYTLMKFVRGSSEAKRSYDKIKDAFECAKVNGYGIVQPSDEDMSLENPAVVRQGGSVGIRLRATAPSYHIVKVEVTGEVNPIMGSAAQSEGIVQGMMNGFETRPDDMWDTNLFGKSLRGMVKEGLSGKVTGMPDDVKSKMRRAITRIINEGKGGVICILL